MSTYLLLFQLSFGLLIFYLEYLKRKKITSFFKLLDYPDNIRKFHKKPTPLIGGIFLYTTFLIIFFLELYFTKIIDPFFTLMIFSSFCFFIGVLDDKFNIKAHYKLLFISTFLVIFLLFNNEYLLDKLFFFQLNKIYALTKIQSIFLTTLCILLLMNAFNMTDGINGLSTGISFIWIFIFSNIFQLPSVYFLVMFFLLVNFIFIYNGKYFLGDSGSLLLSSFIGLTSIYYYNKNIFLTHPVFVEEIILIFLIPGLDMFRLFLKRILNKKNPLMGDTNHLHHILCKNFKLNASLIIYYSIIIFPFMLLKVFNIEFIYLLLTQIIMMTLLILYPKKIKSYHRKKNKFNFSN